MQSKLACMRRELCLAAAVPLFFLGVAWGAVAKWVPVTVDVGFVRGSAGAVPSAPADAVAGDAWIFVLDHSGSMGIRDAIVCTEGLFGAKTKKTSRWEALLESFNVTLGQIEYGTVIQVVRVSCKQAELVRFGGRTWSVVSGDRERDDIYKTIKGWGAPNGDTPLYHGLFLACQEAQRLIRSENRNVGIVVYSDGDDVSDNSYTQESLKKFKDLFDEDAFNACLTWIGDVKSGLPPPPFGPKYVWAQPPQSGNVVPPVCRVRPGEAFVSLENPLSGGKNVRIPISYLFPLDEGKWEELVHDGIEANLQLVGTDDRVYGGEAVTVGPQGGHLVFRLPAECFQGTADADFSLTVGLPQTAAGCRLLAPRPVRISFEKQGSVTISEVKPQSGLAAKVGESIQFAANGTAGATYEWTFGDGTKKVTGQRVTHAYTVAAPDGIEYTVTAKKAGLMEEKASGTVTVLEAGVALEALPTGLEVGKAATFRCRGTGEVASYDWFVDGAPAAGGQMEATGGAGLLTVTFDRAGRHTVRVRANMKRVSPEETPEMGFEVGAAPYAAVTNPAPNQTFSAEALVDLAAHVEGGAVKGTWRIGKADGTPACEPIPAPVVDGTALAQFPAPAEGGTFTVTFEIGEGAGCVTSAPVRFAAKSKDVRLDVVAPLPGEMVQTGKPVELRAVSKGVSGVVEFWLEAEGTEASKIGEEKVAADGTAALAHPFPAKDGQGARTLTARSADGVVVSDPVEFMLQTPAGLVLKKPAQNASVAYGGTLEFEAEPSGVVEAGAVRWFLRPMGGTEEALEDGKGAHCEHRFGPIPNRKSVPYEVYARAPLPDGTELETDHAMVRAECPALAPRLLTAEKVYETGLPVTFRAEHAGTVGRVTWDFGDGGTGEGAEDQTAHTFGRTGSLRVRATLTCATCGEEASAETTVELRCPDLVPRLAIVGEISEASEENLFARGKPIRMSVTCEGRDAAGRVADVAWTFGDGEGETGLDTVNHSYRDYGERTVTVSVKCSACGREEKATRTLRIDKVPPKAHFKICRSTSSEKSIGGWVAQGTTIALVDQDHGAGDVAHSTGDVDRRRWTCNGEPIPGSEDRNIVEWDCRTVGKHVFELTVFDPLGEPAAPESHSVRVYRLWLIWLLLLLAAGASGWAWWVWGGNNPRFWEVVAFCDKDGKLGETDVTGCFTGKVSMPLEEWWRKYPKKKAVIPLHELGGIELPEEWGVDKPAGQITLEVWESQENKGQGDMSERHPAADIGGAVPDGVVCDASMENGHLIRISKVSGSKPGMVTAIWVKIDTSATPQNTHLWIGTGLTLLYFCIAFLLCAAFGF